MVCPRNFRRARMMSPFLDFTVTLYTEKNWVSNRVAPWFVVISTGHHSSQYFVYVFGLITWKYRMREIRQVTFDTWADHFYNNYAFWFAFETASTELNRGTICVAEEYAPILTSSNVTNWTYGQPSSLYHAIQQIVLYSPQTFCSESFLSSRFISDSFALDFSIQR